MVPPQAPNAPPSGEPDATQATPPPAPDGVDRLSLVGPAGTGKVMGGELSRLAKRASLAQKLQKPRNRGPGTISLPFDAALAHLAVRYHRTSSRVLWDLYSSRAERLEPLYDSLLPQVTADGRPWMRDGMTLSVGVRNVSDFAAGGRQIVGTVKNALIDGARARGVQLEVAPEDPDVSFSVGLWEGELTVSIDLAGRPMNQRGYRDAAGLAPLRESLAAVLVMLARHDGRHEALYDPMAGTGTLAIEAASMAKGAGVWLPPRVPACMGIDPFRGMPQGPAEPLFGDTRALCIANELSPQTAALCRAQVERAGVQDAVECREGDFRALSPDTIADLCEARGFSTERGVILCNPPYGVRLDGPDGEALRDLYRDLGDYCSVFRGWRAAFIVDNPDFERAFGGRARIKKPLSNGSLRSFFLLYDL